MSDQNPESTGSNPEPPVRPPGGNYLPPRIAGGLTPIYPGAPQPLGSNPAEQVPVAGVFGAVEAVLRQPRRVMFHLKQPGPGGLIGGLLAIAVACSLVYGLVAGTFSGGDQLWGAPVKIVIGLLVSALICLPSLYIFSCLSGSDARLVEVFGLVAGLLALMTLLLLGFAPVAWVFSQSTKSVVVMGSLLLAFWFVATIFGLRFLHSGFRHMNGTSDAGFYVWVVIFLLVALQMTTALRPILGKATTFLPAATDKKFFIEHWSDCVKLEETATPRNPDAAR